MDDFRVEVRRMLQGSFRRILPLCMAMLLPVLLPGGAIYAQGTDQAGDRTVNGIVTDESGIPLVGVYVFVENTTNGVSTNLDGEYSIVISENDPTLVFSCLGFQTQKFPITGSTTINVALAQDAQNLDEVVVVGYGVQKKESSVAAITQVKGDDLANVNATSISNALSGQVPGVSIVQTSGEPGYEATNIMIRGVSSWVSSSPLVLVDGVERDFSNIDPTEIETMSVLKDASATAVFGVRGANGVILITTKRGQAGEVKVNFSAEAGIKQPINMISPMDSYNTGLVINEARKNDNDWGAMLSDEVLEHYRVQDMPYVYPNTNWQDALLKNGIQHKYNVNVSGGTDFARVFASLSYLHEGDVIRTEKNEAYDPTYKYDRYNYRFNVDMNVTKTTVISIDAGGYIGIKNRPYESNTQRRFRPLYCLGPMDGVLYYPAEVLDEYPDLLHPDETGMRLGTTDLTNAENPMIANSYSGSTTIKTSNINLSVRLKQDLSFITKGLSAKIQASYNNLSRWLRSIEYNAITYKLLESGTWVRRVGRDENTRDENIPSVGTESLDGNPYPVRNYYYEFSVDYNRTFGKHTVTGLVVGQRRKVMQNAVFLVMSRVLQPELLMITTTSIFLKPTSVIMVQSSSLPVNSMVCFLHSPSVTIFITRNSSSLCAKSSTEPRSGRPGDRSEVMLPVGRDGSILHLS